MPSSSTSSNSQSGVSSGDVAVVGGGGRPSIRPRPLDPYKQIPVVVKVEEFEKIQQDLSGLLDPSTTASSSSSTTQDNEGKASLNKKRKKDVVVGGSNIKQDKRRKKHKASNNTSPPPEKALTLTEQLAIDSIKSTSASGGNSGGGKPKEALFNLPVPESESSSIFDEFITTPFHVDNAYIRHRLGHIDDYHFTGDVEYELSYEDEQYIKETLSKKYPDNKYSSDENMFEKMIDLLERKTGKDFPINLQDAISLFSKYLSVDSNSKENKSLIQDVYNWWISRRTKLHKPLLRRFWPVTAANDSSPNLTFRPREKERYRLRKKRQNDLESYEKLLQLKSDFEMMKCLLELVRRRENLRQAQIDLLENEHQLEIEQLIYKDSTKSTATKKRIEDIKIDVGPLEQTQVDQVFAPLVKTPQSLRGGPLSPVHGGQGASGPLHALNQGYQQGGNQVDLLSIEADSISVSDQPKKRKKQKKKKDLDPNQLNDDGTNKTNKQTGQASQQSTEPVIPLEPPKPQLPQSYLRPLDNVPLYTNEDFENLYPKIPTWPPADYRRTLMNRQPPPTHKVNNMRYGIGPPLKTHLHQFHERKKFRCRARVGRGGRLIVDRVPISSSNTLSQRPIEKPLETYTGPDPGKCGHEFLDPNKSRSLSLQTIQPVSLSTTSKTKLQAIYLQEDSEDEDVEILEYPYLAPLKMDPEEQARLEAAVNPKPTKVTFKETKFRFII